MTSETRVFAVFVFVALTVVVGAKQGSVGNGPTVAITSPSSSNASLDVRTPTVFLSGRAQPRLPSAISNVIWRNNRGGTGTAMFDARTNTWTTTGLGGANAGSSADLTMQAGTAVPSPDADDVWREAPVNAPPIAFLRGIDAFLRPSSPSSVDVEIPSVVNTLELLTRTSEHGYDVSLTLASVRSEFPHGAALVFAYRDEANHCAAVWYAADAITHLVLLKRSEGRLSQLGEPSNIDSATDESVSIAVRGDALDVRVDGVSRITATDGECGEATTVGSGAGAQPDGGSDDAGTILRFDGLTAPDQDTVAGIPLQPGANVITVTAVDTTGRTATETVTVVFTPPERDTLAPWVSFTSPTSELAYSATAPTVDLSISASDDATVMSCRFACTTCAPNAGTLARNSAGAWFASGVRLANGVNGITATCVDAAGNEGHATVTVTLASDSSPTDSLKPTNSSDPVTVTYTGQDVPAAPVTIAWDWNGSPATRFRLWCNGAIARDFSDVELTRQAMGAGVTEIRATLTGLKGTLQCVVSAYETVEGQVVESEPSNPITLNFEGVVTSR